MVSYSGLEESSAGELGGDLLVKSITGFDGNFVFSRDLQILINRLKLVNWQN